jgi:hypothetical protein
MSTLTLIISLVDREILKAVLESIAQAADISACKAPYNTNDEPNQSDYSRFVLLAPWRHAQAGRADRPGHRKRPGLEARLRTVPGVSTVAERPSRTSRPAARRMSNCRTWPNAPAWRSARPPASATWRRQ